MKCASKIPNTSGTEELPGNVNGTNSHPKRIRRIKSVSDALHLLGNTMHSIFERHIFHHHNSRKSNSAKNSVSSLELHTETPIHNYGVHFETDVPAFSEISEGVSSDDEDDILAMSSHHSSQVSSLESDESMPSIPLRKHSPRMRNERRVSDSWVKSATQNETEESGTFSSNETENVQPKEGILKVKGKFLKKGISFQNDSDTDADSDSSKGAHISRSARRNTLAPRKAFVHKKSVDPVDPHQVHRNVDDLLFDMFQEKDEEVVLVGNFLAALEKTGLRRSDPRLVELFENLKQVHREQEVQFPKRTIGSIETLRLNRVDFKKVIADNIVLISRAFRKQFIIPEFQHFCKHIEEMYEKCKKVSGGKVAAYIPQLARVNPNYWGVSICTIDGQRHSIGDTTIPFTLQSCSKPLTYAIALNELGEDTVHQYVGQEPSGRMFNELVLDYNKKPHNPMVNAGAIIVISLLKSMVRPELTLAEKFDYTLQYFKRLGGGEYLGFNNAVFLSEREAADRNYALGFYMREHKCFPEGTNLKECMDYYFQVCSMETNCEATAVMAATLANGGICPVSGEKVLKSDSVRDVLSLMHSCGMYDYSGQFAFKVGLPAKSGVSGCIILVVPNVLGMCIWSPPLDALGNTVRGVTFCQELVEVFNFHKYDNLRHASHKIDPRRHKYETKGLNIVNLLFAAASGDVTSMRRLHLSGMDMSAMDYDGRTAIHLASAEGHLECVEYLLRHCRVSHKPRDRWNNFPLDDAVRFGHEDVAEFLRKWDEEHGGGGEN